MPHRSSPIFHIIVGVAACLAAAVAAQSPARAHDAALSCNGPPDVAQFNRPLLKVAERIALGGPVTIVAIGSSSTAGAGASSTAASYPSRLEFALRTQIPGVSFKVVNRGVNGEEVRDMLARLDLAVIAENPDLVIWQLGTNTVLRDHDIGAQTALVREGLVRLKSTGADVVLMDPQFAPKVTAKGDAVDRMVELISAVAKGDNVELFHRFALTRYWREARLMPFDVFLAPDELHMNDWGYDCVASLLADAIVAAATRTPQTARAPAASR